MVDLDGPAVMSVPNLGSAAADLMILSRRSVGADSSAASSIIAAPRQNRTISAWLVS